MRPSWPAWAPGQAGLAAIAWPTALALIVSTGCVARDPRVAASAFVLSERVVIAQPGEAVSALRLSGADDTVGVLWETAGEPDAHHLAVSIDSGRAFSKPVRVTSAMPPAPNRARYSSAPTDPSRWLVHPASLKSDVTPISVASPFRDGQLKAIAEDEDVILTAWVATGTRTLAIARQPKDPAVVHSGAGFDSPILLDVAAADDPVVGLAPGPDGTFVAWTSRSAAGDIVLLGRAVTYEHLCAPVRRTGETSGQPDVSRAKP